MGGRPRTRPDRRARVLARVEGSREEPAGVGFDPRAVDLGDLLVADRRGRDSERRFEEEVGVGEKGLEVPRPLAGAVRGDGHEGVDVVVVGVDAIEGRLEDADRCPLAVVDLAGEPRRRSEDGVGRHEGVASVRAGLPQGDRPCHGPRRSVSGRFDPGSITGSERVLDDRMLLEDLDTNCVHQ